ncbi:hypothetical protein IAT38_000680 [Cryptococcus sp. DSM 104549]
MPLSIHTHKPHGFPSGSSSRSLTINTSTYPADDAVIPPRTPSPAAPYPPPSSYATAKGRALPAIRVDGGDAGDGGGGGGGRRVWKVKSIERTRSWAEEVERSRRSGGEERRAMDDVERRERERAREDDMLGIDEPYSQPYWSVSTEVIDSLVSELNPHLESPPSLPTAASIISANARRSYVLESDDEAGSSSSPSEGMPSPLWETVYRKRSPKAAGRKYGAHLGAEPVGRGGKERGREKRRSKKGSASPTSLASPVSPLDPAPPRRSSSEGEDRLLTHTPSPPPKPKPKAKPKVEPPVVAPVLSIDDIIKRHSAAVGNAEAAVKEKARKEMGILGGSGGLPRLSESSRAGGGSRAKAVEQVVSPVDPLPPVGTGSAAPFAQDDTPPTPPAKPRSSNMTPRAPPVPVRNNTFPRAAAPPTTYPQTPSRTTRSKADASRKELVRAATASSTSLSGESFKQGARMGQALLDQLERDSTVSSSSSKRISFQAGRPGFGSRPSTPSRTPKGSKHLSLPATPPSSSPAAPSPTEGEAHEHAKYLRSPHLNRTVTLPRQFPDRPLCVSYAEVGDPSGHPVVIFLGLGCVRYLIALFDDIARAFSLRLICIDRWGLGKTDEVPRERRGVMDWAGVVERVLDEIKVDKFQVVAHSAGAPYALACAIKMEERVRGKVYLLAPWVSADIDGGYKWLKWVPNGVIKSATAAEWRLQSYLLGKPPPLTYKPVGHNAHAPVSYHSTSHLPQTHSNSTPHAYGGRNTTPTPSSEEEGLYRESKSASSSAATTPVRAPGLVRKASKIFGPRSMDILGPGHGEDPAGSPGAAGHGGARVKTLRRSFANLRTHSDVVAPSFHSRGGVPSPPSPRSLQAASRVRLDDDEDEDEDSETERVDFGLGEGFDSFSNDLRIALPPSFKFTPSHTSLPTASTSSLTRSATSASTSTTASTDRPKAPTGAAFTLALTQASHAECEPGTTSDLLSIVLNRDAKPWGFSYTQVKQPVRIWYGKEDDKISEKSMRWMERCMQDVELEVVEREGHGLLSSVKVMWEVFESLGKEARAWKKQDQA